MYDFYKIFFSKRVICLNKYLHPFSKNLILLKKIHAVKKIHPVKQTHSVKLEFYFNDSEKINKYLFEILLL